MIRGIITSVVEGMIKRFSASGRTGETISNREYMQHYGLTSRPLSGAEGIIIKNGNHYIMVASDDRRYRLAIENGEVALYTDEGDTIHLKRGKVIEIIAGEQLVITTKVAGITAASSTTVTSPKVTVASPEINLGGDRAALQALVDERLLALFNAHTHGGGPVPDVQLSQADSCTTITKAG